MSDVGGMIRAKYVTNLSSGTISIRQVDDLVQIRILNDASVGAVTTLSVEEATAICKLMMAVMDAIDPSDGETEGETR